MSETFGMIRHMNENTRKNKGWFSRRHETSEANAAAREAFLNRAEGRPKQRWVWDDESAKVGHWEKVSE